MFVRSDEGLKKPWGRQNIIFKENRGVELWN